jgi:hypothetical protein
MAKYYYTLNEEPRNVYHDSQDCEEGKKIEAKDRRDTDELPPDRYHCEKC